MSVRVGPQHRLATTLSWPLGIAWTAWHYMWRTLPVHRREEAGEPAGDLPPALPDTISHEGIQRPADGAGPLLHRTYSCTVVGGVLGPDELIDRLAADPDVIAPRRLARFRKTRGEEGRLSVGDEFLVHMPGPWDGPVRVVEVGPDRFRFATLEGHLEAGQIEWRARAEAAGLGFAIESWARAGDRLSALMHDELRMAKEVQLYMWTSVMQRAARVAGGRLRDGVHVRTRRVAEEAL